MVTIDDIIREARLTGISVYDHELLNAIIDAIDMGKLTAEESKKIGEIRILAYEQAKKKIKEAV